MSRHFDRREENVAVYGACWPELCKTSLQLLQNCASSVLIAIILLMDSVNSTGFNKSCVRAFLRDRTYQKGFNAEKSVVRLKAG